MRAIVEWIGRDELRAAWQAHGLDAESRARPLLAGHLLQALGAHDSAPPPGLFGARVVQRLTPVTGDIALVRQRQYLVEDIVAPAAPSETTRIDLVCLDDDAQGRRLSVRWELELGAKVLQPETEGLGTVAALDSPRRFAAYFHALKWSQVTATRADLFQAPFRAGIKLLDHQLTPLKKALELPRASLFIADDVGLGKTIEAGLVMQELQLRQRVDFVLVIFINLQKRLLSSIEAFHRTLNAHAAHVEAGTAAKDVQLDLKIARRAVDEDDDTYGADDEQRDADDTAEVVSAALASSEGRAREILQRMLDLARQHRHGPDAKVHALLHGLRAELYAGSGAWGDRRVILFTEYGDTMRYLQRTLGAAIEDTHRIAATSASPSSTAAWATRRGRSCSASWAESPAPRTVTRAHCTRVP